MGGGMGGGTGSLALGEWYAGGSKSKPNLLLLFPITACSDEVLGCNKGLGGRAGLESSG